MGGNLIKLLKKHLESLEEFPESLLGQEIPKALELHRPTLKDVDQYMVRIYDIQVPIPRMTEYWKGSCRWRLRPAVSF